MRATLYQFPISHYCEKVRWALHYKGVPYQAKTLLPGLHIKTLQKIVPGNTVPVIQIDATTIQGSDRIIDYLDELVLEKPLTPQDETLKHEAAEWETFAASKIAEPLRCFYYHYMLDDPRTLIPLFAEGGPWYSKFVMGLIFNRLNRRMRAGYQINQRTAQVAMHVVDKALKHLEQHLAHRPFLVGESFTRADLAVCALLSPLVMPERGYLKQGSVSAQALTEYRKAHLSSPVFRWVNSIYNTYR